MIFQFVRLFFFNWSNFKLTFDPKNNQVKSSLLLLVIVKKKLRHFRCLGLLSCPLLG